MEFYTAVKKNALLLHTTQWMDLKSMTLSEKS